jgi:hypothetical protein
MLGIVDGHEGDVAGHFFALAVLNHVGRRTA